MTATSQSHVIQLASSINVSRQDFVVLPNIVQRGLRGYMASSSTDPSSWRGSRLSSLHESSRSNSSGSCQKDHHGILESGTSLVARTLSITGCDHRLLTERGLQSHRLRTQCCCQPESRSAQFGRHSSQDRLRTNQESTCSSKLIFCYVILIALMLIRAMWA